MSEDKRDADALSADVSDEVIQAALASVERRTRSSPGATPAEVVDGPPADLDKLEQELREVRAQLDLSVERARETLDRLKDSHERHLRAAADLENYKKRAVREKEEAERFGIQRLLKDLLPVMDNLDRAIAHATEENPLTEGVAATRRIFEDTLARYGVQSFTAVGQPFDPNRHEAMQQTASAEVAPGTVISELVRGYTLHDRLVRPALVTVSVAPAAETLQKAKPEDLPGSPDAVAESQGGPSGDHDE